MRKLRFFKALFVAAALALVIPGCSGVDSDEGTNIPQTQGNKVALKISASEGYRTALPTVDLSSYTYELTADVMTENTPAGEPTSLIPAGASYADLIKANSVYVEADKTYLFVLKATNGSSEILSGTLTQAISTSNNSLSFKLFAVDSTSDTGSVSIDVTYAAVYGVGSVVPTLHKMDGTSLAETYPLTYTPADSAGTGRVTGSVPVGKSYVKIVLKDASSTEVGSIPQEAVYAVKGLTSSSAVNIQVKKYKATIALTTSDDSAPTLTLKNPDITTEGYAGISTSGEGSPFTVTKAGDSAPYTYTYTGYVPTAAYDVYKGATKIGTVQNVTPLELNESVTLESIAVAWKAETAPTLYVGTTESDLRATLTVTATLSSGTNTVTDYTIIDFDATSTSEQTVTVSYTYNGVEKTAQIAVTLEAGATTVTIYKITFPNGVCSDTDKTFVKECSNTKKTGVSVKGLAEAGDDTETYESGLKIDGNAYIKLVLEKESDLYFLCAGDKTLVSTADTAHGYAALTITPNVKSEKVAAGTYYLKNGTGNNQTNVCAIYIWQASSTTTKKDLATSTAPTAAYTLTDSSSYKGDAATITLPSVSVPTTEVTVSGETTTVEGTWAWDDTSKSIAITDWTDGTATVTAKATFTPMETSAYNTLAAQDVTITVTDERVDAGSAIAVTGVTLSKTTLEFARWSTETLTATVSPEDATNKAVSWKSSNTDVVTVEDGKLTAILPGTATITVTTADGEKTATCAVTVNQVYVSGNFTLSSSEYNATALVGKLLSNKMYTIAKVDSNGIYCHKGIASNGYTEFVLESEKKITIAYSVAKEKKSGLVLTTSDGDFATVANSSVVIAGSTGADTLASVLASGDTNTKAAYQVADNSSGSATENYTYTVVLSAGSYKLYGYTSATSAKANALTFEEVSSTPVATFSLTAIGSSDITLSCGDGTVTATPPAGATVSAYSWIVDNVSVDTNTATLSVGSLAAGIHSIVVEATDSSTGVKYAAQYVLMVN